ncbi:MAG TPA: ABC transporter ATP-binding protein [Gaiellaceae bacterium]|nr:ABC transporter ATP-binding protein [Gaiellaceae bacterium]
MNGEAAIVAERLRVIRGRRVALDHLTVEVRGGAVTGLLGPSGSGKSTLMRAVVGVQKITSGDVRVLGQPAGAAQLRRRVAYTTQAPSVYLDLTVRENLRFFARALGVEVSRIDEAIATVGLSAEADRVVGRLSGGERARASLASALLGRPEVLVLDEPTVGLDPVLRRDLWATFAELAAAGATLLVSSHVMDEAERCDDLLLLREGRLLAAGTVDDVRRRTGEHDLDAAFLKLVLESSG